LFILFFVYIIFAIKLRKHEFVIDILRAKSFLERN
jgi:hypothetical protein